MQEIRLILGSGNDTVTLNNLPVSQGANNSPHSLIIEGGDGTNTLNV
ncbi:hypothetical protein [Umezakia ovalisporum]|uniref:Uncharacterized protein n=2 Tax=Umezakia ovalisporum TaxID=75695 RepID=A0AA43GX31_9CYAN|nr:hypothetical protein [Umezakia ovalisporum]MDH6057930.1 hypothetical protein [Umezakia ovalisporum FSS-43]MDH6062885.1 hypothetical protein [Umezakia ovalisporum FSS-62]MDH6066851.1 hypothetical protein [Umezakia ovalisporum APH033B]MDH6071954.1 hypothetical protein [Umezakia ovalisporum CobakiLakeA]MDH6073330.1 hypothetical protein [Umezakia ovalisporum CS-1034]